MNCFANEMTLSYHIISRNFQERISGISTAAFSGLRSGPEQYVVCLSRPNSPNPKLPRVGLGFRSQLSLDWHNFYTATKGGGGNGSPRQSFRLRLRAPCPHHVLASPKSPMQRPVWCVSGEMLHVWTQALPTGRSIIAYMTFDGREDLKKSYCLV